MKHKLTRASVAAGLLMLALLLAGPVQAQDLDQYSPWGPPVNLTAVNSAGAEQGPCISRDGLSLYFAWSPLGTGVDIYVSQRASVNDQWGPPQKLGTNINTTAYDDANPALSPDGHLLFFQSNRPGYGKGDLYVSRRHNKKDDFDWQPAVNLGPLVNTTARERNPYVFEDEVTGQIILYFDSDRTGGLGGFDLYASVLQPDETFGAAVPVTELNSSSDDSTPAVRHDGLEMYFASTRPGTVGKEDLWVSTRATTSDPWSPPTHLDFPINFIGTDSHPELSFDGTTLYFASAERNENVGGQGFFDLWVTTRTKLK